MNRVISNNTFESSTGNTELHVILDYNLWDVKDFHKNGDITNEVIYKILTDVEKTLRTNTKTDGLISVSIGISREVAKELEKLKK